MGKKLASAMLNGEIEVTIIDQNASLLEHLVGHIDVLTVHASGTDVAVLEELNIASYDLTIAVTGNDDTNVLISSLAKKLGCKRTVARIRNPEYSKQLPENTLVIHGQGIDMTINPMNITASNILKYIRGGKVVSVSLLLDGQAEVTEIIASEKLEILNKPLKKLNLPKSIIIGAIVHGSEVIIPNGDSKIHAGDRFVVFSLLSEVPALEKFFKLKDGR